MMKDWVGTVHSHPHDQIVYVVHGQIRFTCQGNTFEARKGDTFVVRGGVQHGASAIENSLAVDVFTPCREDYITRADCSASSSSFFRERNKLCAKHTCDA